MCDPIVLIKGKWVITFPDKDNVCLEKHVIRRRDDGTKYDDWEIEGYYHDVLHALRSFFLMYPRIKKGNYLENVKEAASVLEDILKKIDSTLTLVI